MGIGFANIAPHASKQLNFLFVPHKICIFHKLLKSNKIFLLLALNYKATSTM